MSWKDLPGVKPGVVTGDVAWSLLRHAKKHGYAIPAFNCSSTGAINAVLEAGAKLDRPIMVQFSEGDAAFFVGASLPNQCYEASVLGAVAAAHYCRLVAATYGATVFVHSDHCAKKLLPWLDGMLEADKAFFAAHGEPLFSSHMLGLSEEDHAENVQICADYLKKMAPMNLILEVEIGNDQFCSTPEDTLLVHDALAPISEKFTIAAAFGNARGVHKPGRVKLQPELLGDFQRRAKEKLGGGDRPLFLVFHGGSGAAKEQIEQALRHGVVKVSVDTDTQWAYWLGVKTFYEANEDKLQGQLGNNDGRDRPNKSYYDPRKWLREAETSMRDRAMECCKDVKNISS